MNFDRRLFTIFAIMVTEVLGFSLILPLLPFYAQEFGAGPFQVGLLFATFSFFQFFSSPIMGELSDSIGRRPMLLLSQFSTMISFVMLGFAGSIWMIALSRMVDGIFGSNMTIAQAYLSDISTEQDRTKYFGMTGIAFGLGFMIGPGVSGYLSQFGFGVPAFLAAAVSLATVLMTWLFLPETRRRDHSFDLHKVTFFDIKRLQRYWQQGKTRIALTQFTLFSLTHMMWVSSFALYAERVLDFNAADTGWLLTFIGVVSVVSRALVLPKLLDLLGEYRLLLSSLAILFVSMIPVVFPVNTLVFYGTGLLYASAISMLQPISMSVVSRAADKDQQGAIMGVSTSLGSITQIVAPLVGGWVISMFAAEWIGVVVIFLVMLMSLVSVRLNRVLNLMVSPAAASTD